MEQRGPSFDVTSREAVIAKLRSIRGLVRGWPVAVYLTARAR